MLDERILVCGWKNVFQGIAGQPRKKKHGWLETPNGRRKLDPNRFPGYNFKINIWIFVLRCQIWSEKSAEKPTNLAVEL